MASVSTRFAENRFHESRASPEMTSIHTNAAAMSALATLRNTSAGLAATQASISTGLRVREASDNASYWSIGVTMRSDGGALAAVQDALGLGTAVLDISYAALDQVRVVLDKIKSTLVLAQQPGIDREKLQQEIKSLADQTVSIADAASFSGTNWLVTDIADIFETDLTSRSTHIVSSFSRTASGSVTVGRLGVDLQKTALYNVQGGGILQGDPRSPETAGGIRTRYLDPNGFQYMSSGRSAGGSPATASFTFSGPLSFGPGDSITFDLTVDADNPAHGIAPPYDPGIAIPAITINRAVVDTVLPAAGGVIADYRDMVSVLSHVLVGTGARATHYVDHQGLPIPNLFSIISREDSGLDGSSISISGFTSTVGSGGMGDITAFGTRGSLSLTFEAFKVYKDVEISFDFSVNDGPNTNHVIDRSLVDTVLGKETGRVDTPAEMAALLEVLIGGPGLLIEAGAGGVAVRTDPDYDRLAGGKTRVSFSGVAINIEPIPQLGLFDIDIVTNSALLRDYLSSVEGMLNKVIDGAAALGALKSRVEIQEQFNSNLSDSIERGIGQLVDEDMEAAAARLKALEVQQQLSFQALALANEAPQRLLQLFNR